MTWHEINTSERRVLELLAEVQHPLGYFGIATRLELRKPLLRHHLADVLRALVDKGLVEHQRAPGYRSGAYHLNEAGRHYLATEFPTLPEAELPEDDQW